MTNDVSTDTQAQQTTEAALRAQIAELEAERDKERDQATDYMKRWQYAQAELANMRRRTQQEREDLTKYGIAPLAATLLEVLDNFERAEQAIPPALQSFTWISGVMLIHRQLAYLLQQHGMEPVAASGKTYDATIHEALVQEHHDTVADGVIIAEVQRGYTLHGRLLRPALVRVSQGPAAKDEEPSAGAEQDHGEQTAAPANESGSVE